MKHRIFVLGQTTLFTSYPADWSLPSRERKAGSVLVLMQFSFNGMF